MSRWMFVEDHSQALNIETPAQEAQIPRAMHLAESEKKNCTSAKYTEPSIINCLMKLVFAWLDLDEISTFALRARRALCRCSLVANNDRLVWPFGSRSRAQRMMRKLPSSLR